MWRKLLNLHRPPPDTLGGPSRYIDWTNARVWIEQCPSPHGLPRNLKVIDVLQNRVVDAPAGCRYLALSYVFGGVKAEHITLPDALPATIGDAIIACQKLGVQYLWVDQLCISQKNSCVLQEQINQMHDIYQHAVCSLVALTGENSNCGLPGVTRSRPQVQNVVEIAGFMFTSLMPNIHDCIKFSKWATRGWTLQEAIFSDCFLFFTDYGLHFVQRNAVGIKRAQIKSDVISGVPAEYTLPSKDKFWTMLGKYNARDLSYPEDALRAFSAVLRSTYGDNTYYGHPREQIDKAAVWHIAGDRTASRMRTMFPSWSWASNSGPIGFLKANAALAVWAAPEGSTDSGTNIILCTPAPDEDWGERGISRESRGLVKDHQIARRQNLFFTIDVAWEVGSIKCSRLFESGLHWSRAATLAERWPTYDAYWHSTLGNYDIDTIFSERDRATAASAEGRILLHGQTASFPLVGTEGSLHKTGKLRIMSEDGMVAGVVVVPSYCEPAGDGEFVALSIGDIDGLNFRYDLYDFARSMGVSIDEFIEGLLFYDSTGNSIPPPWDASFLAARQCVIVLNVLLIERDEQSNVARRLGLGYVFLKRWVEAKPIFETIILE
ncbi:heterokaryon incompatibility protein-domain-containing protein [Aspergillus pseudonomiae]|nr:heterokaryon incompatibility protein-domain-containing protein [Aspergillus pseudonomiae]